MKWFALYTGARALLFAVVWLLVWLVASNWLDWNTITGLWTALLALVITAPISLLLLGPLRDRLAEDIARRAARTKENFNKRRSAEDDL